MGKLIGGIVIVLVVLGGIYYWSSSSKPATMPAPQDTMTQPKNTAPTVAPEAPSIGTMREEIMVTGNEFAFQPSTLTLKKGEAVKITFKNTGKYPHNLAISGYNVATKTVAPGEEDSIQFTPDKTGTFPYSCTVDSHADKGMKGTLTVQ